MFNLDILKSLKEMINPDRLIDYKKRHVHIKETVQDGNITKEITHNVMRTTFYDRLKQICYKQDLYPNGKLETEIKRTSSKDTYDIAYEGTETTEDFVYAKTDGSLHHGVEFVTHPITFKAWRETYLERLENELLSKLRVDLEEQPRTAGIHIHYNRKALGRNEDTRKTVIARLCFILSKQENYEYLTKFCKRNPNDISHWAKPYYIYHENDYSVPITQTMNLIGADRYHVVNLKNSNTIEFRCFGATTDIRDIQAYMVFIHNIVDFCKKNNDQVIRDTKLEDIMTIYYKKFMTDYLRERGLL